KEAAGGSPWGEGGGSGSPKAPFQTSVPLLRTASTAAGARRAAAVSRASRSNGPPGGASSSARRQAGGGGKPLVPAERSWLMGGDHAACTPRDIGGSPPLGAG